MTINIFVFDKMANSVVVVSKIRPAATKTAYAKKNQFEILDVKGFNSKVPVLPQNIENLVNDFNRKNQHE